MRRFLPLLLLLVIAMGQGGKIALQDLTGLTIQEGTYEYLDGTRDVAVKAKGKDQFDNAYTIRCRWKNGLPVAIYVYVMEEKL